MKPLRVMVFSAAFGAGHFQAAEAIVEAVKEKRPDAEIVHLDFMEFLNKPVNRAIKNVYLGLIKHAPGLWGKFYYKTAKISPSSTVYQILHHLGKGKFLKFIEKKSPDIIVCTYPTIACVLGELRQRKLLQVPVVTAITDFAAHSHWIHQGVDLYAVASTKTLDSLVAAGIKEDRVRVTGIPVSLTFEGDLDRQRIALKLGLNPTQRVCLIMGGAFGALAGVKKICEMLSVSLLPIQTVVVCGKDRKLFASLEEVALQSRNPVIRLGFVTNVEELMTVADFVVTKAGGLTVSEALTKNVPLFIYKPIPGQEEENAHYLEEVEAGRIACSESELLAQLKIALENPAELEKMRQAQALVAPKSPAARTVEFMLHLHDTNQKLLAG